MEQEVYLRRGQAAAYLQERFGAYTTETLAKLAVTGQGPRFRKIGPYPVYTPHDLENWAAARMTRLVQSTSELSAEG